MSSMFIPPTESVVVKARDPRKQDEKIQIQHGVWLVTWYSRTQGYWWGKYIDAEGNQMGDAWFDRTRDLSLIHI